MEIKKEFSDLIYQGKKKYEFRNTSAYFNEYYKIKNKLYKLEDYFEMQFDKKIYKSLFSTSSTKPTKYYFNTFSITKQEYEWLKNNIEYFRSYQDDYCVHIGKWVKLDIAKLEIINAQKNNS